MTNTREEIVRQQEQAAFKLEERKVEALEKIARALAEANTWLNRIAGKP